jgi:hypothetical protein
MRESTQLLPWNGYWLEALQPCELVLQGNSVEAVAGRETHAHIAGTAESRLLNSP